MIGRAKVNLSLFIVRLVVIKVGLLQGINALYLFMSLAVGKGEKWHIDQTTCFLPNVNIPVQIKIRYIL
jgi:hypothetical protein